jgi:hypothetical protein
MIKSIDFPKKEFATKEDLFKALLANKDLLIKEKTSQIYKSCEKGSTLSVSQESMAKALETNKAFKMDSDFYYIAVNSSDILDSHGDLHIKGNWDKTVKEQQKKVFLVFDHQLKRSEIIAMKEDIEMMTAEVPFSLIGKNYEGKSYMLIYKIPKDKIVNDDARNYLEKGYSLEGSVRMQYVKIELAIKSKDKEYEKEKVIYDKYIGNIANAKEFKTIDYFWAVTEAKNVAESSLVMFGSNPATGMIQEQKEEKEAVEDTSTENKEEPSKDTQIKRRRI